MKLPGNHTRTTLTLDQTTINYLTLIAKYHGALWVAVDQAVEYFKPDYRDLKQFEDGSTVRINRAESILNYAREMDEKESSLSSEKRTRKITKSVVIDKYCLKCINKAAKANQIKRDFLFISAIKHERDADYKLARLDLELSKDLLETLQSIHRELNSKLRHNVTVFEKYMRENKVYDSGFYHVFDIEYGLHLVESYEALQKDIDIFEKRISLLEDIS